MGPAICIISEQITFFIQVHSPFDFSPVQSVKSRFVNFAQNCNLIQYKTGRIITAYRKGSLQDFVKTMRSKWAVLQVF